MSDLQTVQMMLCDMASDLDTGALAVYRAAWERDCRGVTSAYGPSMAKLVATEAAGRIADRAVQLSGGAGVTHGNLVAKLFREARAMRIYEGAPDVQRTGEHTSGLQALLRISYAVFCLKKKKN